MTEHDLQLAPGSINVKLHKKLFPKKNTVLVMKDSTNQEDVFFVHKLGDLRKLEDIILITRRIRACRII